jgi:hypothetical protein
LPNRSGSELLDEPDVLSAQLAGDPKWDK